MGRGKFPSGEELVQREYSCPGCGVLFGVDIGLAKSEPLFDIELMHLGQP